MADKPKIAICWFGGCGGCDEAIVDLNEDILEVTGAFDIVLWPVALDFKYKHIQDMGDKEILLSIINGSVRNSEHEELAHLLRQKSVYVVSFGACACFGGSPGLANMTTKKDIFGWVYGDAPTVVNPTGNVPQVLTIKGGHELTLPEFYPKVYALNSIIDVDYYLPGCPPPPDLIHDMARAAITGDLPPKGSTLAPLTSLCDVCDRNETKPERLEIPHVKRIHQVLADPEKCFLAQGIICAGPATRRGCGEACIKINIPCRGCFGPVEGVVHMGSKFLSALASLIFAETEDGRKTVADEIVDPAGYFYRFTAATSLLGKRR
jgi:F420-non-reducing hydrogenase small subunit